MCLVLEVAWSAWNIALGQKGESVCDSYFFQVLGSKPTVTFPWTYVCVHQEVFNHLGRCFGIHLSAFADDVVSISSVFEFRVRLCSCNVFAETQRLATADGQCQCG